MVITILITLIVIVIITMVTISLQSCKLQPQEYLDVLFSKLFSMIYDFFNN